MSIRLRLTLLYSAVLLVTLLAFGGLLYIRQAQATLEIEKRFLIGAGERIADQTRMPPAPDPSAPPEPFFERFLQRRSADGSQVLEVQTPDNVVLPLSARGMEAVQNGEAWMEAASVEGEQLLIYSLPVGQPGHTSEVLQLARSLSARDQGLRSLGMGLLVGGLVAIVVAFILGWLLGGTALRPIQRLTETAQAIGTEHDFSRRVVQIGPDDEVGRLAKTFNGMLAELQAAYQQVALALEKQRRFVADVSHELRTPLTTLNGNVELLRREPPISAEDRTEVLSDMASESKRLVRLVNDLLQLARTEARPSLGNEPVRLKPIVEEVVRQARLLDPGRTIDHELQLDATVLAEADGLRQILLILLDNAIKYTEGPIEVSTAMSSGRAAVSIQDSGPGIDPELLPHLFQRFSRGPTGASPSGLGAERGFGLGLAIAKTLIEAQNGTLAVRSQVAAGACFVVTLPLAEG